ncbi:MAG TPA: aminoglycoside phosphotransferase family protein [Acidimicrobiales bacterium]|nr:aminoglycoside phosphotransferase family protein [Acidimicrobiales bacterium]
MVTLPPTIQALADRTLGPVRVVADLSWGHGEALVVAVESPRGERAVVKAHRDARSYRNEVEAYGVLAGPLAGDLPRVLAHDDGARALVLSWVPGTPADRLPADDERLHRAAGALLRRFHGALQPEPLARWRRRLAGRLARWIDRAGDGVLTAAEVAAARGAVEAVGDAEPAGVLTHGDWQRRNWIVDGSTVRAIDLEHARREVWLLDLQKLWWGDWRRAPHLRDAFLAGYDPEGEVRIDPVAFRAVAAVQLVATVVWAVEHSDRAYAEAARDGLRAAVACAP